MQTQQHTSIADIDKKGRLAEFAYSKWKGVKEESIGQFLNDGVSIFHPG